VLFCPLGCVLELLRILLELEDQLATEQPLTLATRKSGEASRATLSVIHDGRDG
jgi:hypothetical protein